MVSSDCCGIKASNKLRICIDLTKLDEQVKREYYQLPSVEETLAKLGDNCVIMSKIDANSGYWQSPLSEESQLMATFITPFGRYCPTRGPFGLTSMPEIFSKRLDALMQGVKGLAKSMDDFLAYGRNVQEHDENLRNILQIMRENNMTLNLEKCCFRQTEATFLRYQITSESVLPVNRKVEAIPEFKTPPNIKELHSFMRMAQQLSRFSPLLAEAAEPL